MRYPTHPLQSSAQAHINTGPSGRLPASTQAPVLPQEQLALLGQEHAQAVAALKEALAGLQAAQQAGDTARRDSVGLREAVTQLRAVQVIQLGQLTVLPAACRPLQASSVLQIRRACQGPGTETLRSQAQHNRVEGEPQQPSAWRASKQQGRSWAGAAALQKAFDLAQNCLPRRHAGHQSRVYG